MHTPAFTGVVLTPGDDGYEEASRTWNAAFASRPAEILRCTSAADVAAALRDVRERGVPFRVRAGGHSMSGLCSIQDGVIIDITGLSAVTLNEDNSLVYVGGGARLEAVYQTLWKAGLTVPAGTCPRVGMGGHVLGGGMGILSRSRGALVDHLVEVEFVDAEGRLTVANENENPDLFWACRGGGGGNFGVVTRYTMRPTPVQDVTLFTVGWTWDNFAPAIKAWQSWLADADPRINPFLSMFPRDHDLVVTLGVFDGPAEDLPPLLEPLLSAVETQTQVVETVPFIQAVDTVEAMQGDAASADMVRAQGSSAIITVPLNDAALATLQKYLSDPPSHRSEVAIYGMGGNISRLAPDATAFPHRGGLMAFEYRTDWDDPEDDEKNLAWIRDLRHAMAEHTTDAAYVNTIDLALENWLWAYYQDNLPRLMRVKRAYDPGDVFHHPHSIPLSLTEGEAEGFGIPERVRVEMRASGLIT